LLSLAILATAVAGLFTIREAAMRGAANARSAQTAAALAQRLLAETASGALPRGGGRTEFRDHPGYFHRMSFDTVDAATLGTVRRLRIEVFYTRIGDAGDEEAVMAVETLLPPTQGGL
jgi:hypothetical protein